MERTMIVPMRTVDQIEYRKALPSLFHISTARKRKFFLLTCGYGSPAVSSPAYAPPGAASSRAARRASS
jgi:hypothetical protein